MTSKHLGQGFIPSEFCCDEAPVPPSARSAPGKKHGEIYGDKKPSPPLVFDQPAFFARRHSNQNGDAAKAEKSLAEPLRRHHTNTWLQSQGLQTKPFRHTTSGVLSSGQAEKGFDGMSRPVRRPLFSSSTSGKSMLSSSTSDGALPSLPQKLLPSLPQKKHDRPLAGGERIDDPFECKWFEVDVLKTAKGEQVFREDFHAAFDIYQAMHNGVSLPNSKYKPTFKHIRAMQIYQSLTLRRVRYGWHIDLSILDFLKLVWPCLSEREEHILLTWASQRERQLLAINRLKSASRTDKYF